MGRRFSAIRGILVAACVLLAVPAPSIRAQPACPSPGCPAPATAEARTLRIGYTQFAPFSQTNAAGIAEGYSVDLLRMLLEPQGYLVTFVAYANPGDMLAGLAAGQIDVTSLLSFNPERARLGAFTDEVHTFSMNVFVASGGPAVSTVQDLAGLRVGVTRGSQGDQLISAVEGVDVARQSSSRTLLMPLLLGEVDALVSPPESLRVLANRAGLGGRIEQTALTLRDSRAGFLVHPEQPALLAELNAAIAAARADGSIQRLHRVTFRAPAAPFTGRESLALIVAAAAVAGALVFWAWLHLRVLNRARKAQAWADLLSDALNANGASVLVADDRMRPIWWNTLHAQNNPGLVHMLESGTTLEELMANAMQNGAAAVQLPPEQARAEARRRARALQAGAVQKTYNYTPDGRILKRRARTMSTGHYAVVTTDVTALVKAHEVLTLSTSQLEEANAQLKNFSHVAAHDLAGPPNSLRNLHGWIRDDFADLDVEMTADMAENFTLVDRLLERQSNLISDLLEYARSERRGAAQVFDPVDRFGSILDLLSLPPGFDVTLPDTAPRLFADPVAFDIVLRNLISNSVKHHHLDRGRIAVSCQAEADHCVVTVADDGPGIAADQLGTIFQPFRTLKARDAGGGTGLGLALVQRTVGQWGGRVEVVSDPARNDTRFSFTVPLSSARFDRMNVVQLRSA